MSIDIIKTQTTNENPGGQPPTYPEVVRERTEGNQVFWLNSSPPKEVEQPLTTSSEESKTQEALKKQY